LPFAQAASSEAGFPANVPCKVVGLVDSEGWPGTGKTPSPLPPTLVRYGVKPASLREAITALVEISRKPGKRWEIR
jgi:hypothetical protein